MGLKNPIGSMVDFQHNALDPSLRNLRIIGVVRDFHSRSLHSSITPFIFRFYRPWHQYIFIKVDGLNLEMSLENIKNIFKRYAPQYPFRYEFLDDAFNRQYAGERNLRRLFNLFSILSIVVACLGLFGLASFTAEQKTKEVGIRKVLGASISNIVALTGREFIKWILLANLLAWPAGYYLMNVWFKNFIFKTEIGPVVFLVSSGIILLISLLTIGYQILKAAWANPVESLRYE